MELTDNEILQGLKRRDSRITQAYFYGYCRMAYSIYDKRYDLRYKPGMDFYSLAHEYYLSLDKHGFRQLEDRSSGVSLKTWMVGGFRFVLLDKLKGTERERRTESLEERVRRSALRFDVVDDNFKEEVRKTVLELCHSQLGRDSKSSLILQMMLVEGFKGKEVAAQLGMTPSAVSQRYTRLMHDVVTPYFKNNYRDLQVCSCQSFSEQSDNFSMPLACLEVDADCSMAYSDTNDFIFQDTYTMDYSNRITPNNIRSLASGEIFVFGSNLAGMHGGGAARAACLYFGAKMGQGVGLQGQSYAIPTMQGGVETIRPYVDDFISYAKAHPELTFLVTRIGCGIAGFDANDIAPLFSEATSVSNIHLPKDFWEYIV